MPTRRPSRPQPPRADPAPRPLKERLQARLFEPAQPARPGAAEVKPPGPDPQARAPISVSELTERLSRHVAAGFATVCVMGEISKVTVVASGHTYFTLKDAGASLEAMVWADRRAGLGVEPKLGLRVVAVGGIRVFAPAGRYSLHVDVLEPLGAGDLQRAFEALKARLRDEGLFADARKRKLPAFLTTVGLVTSATGAVRHDIERTLARGEARVRLLLAPTRVQGEGAAGEIAEAIQVLSARTDVDAIIVARGGGSIEELWPFNEEAVARAIVASGPPVISAVGHETDFTIADLAADLRASTPSVAAGLIVDIQRQARERTAAATLNLLRTTEAGRDRWRRRLDAVSTHRVIERERTKLERLGSRLSASFSRARVSFERGHASRRSAFRDLATRCEAHAPREVFGRAHGRVDRALLSLTALVIARVESRRTRATRAFESRGLREARIRLDRLVGRFADDLRLLTLGVRPLWERRRSRFMGLAAQLDALSPLAVLSRGYALATTAEGRILQNAQDVAVGDTIALRLSRGRLKATVTDRDEEA